MKKSILLIVLLMIIVSSCTKVEYIPFHFNPEIPYGSQAQIYKAKIFSNEDIFTNLELSLIASVNENDEKFVVISKVNNRFNYKIRGFNDFNLDYSSLIKYKKLKELMKTVKASIDNWDKKQKEKEGIFFQYYNYPEQNVKILSQHVVNIERSFLYEYQNTVKGSIASIYLGEKSPFMRQTQHKEDVISFHKALKDANSYLATLSNKKK